MHEYRHAHGDKLWELEVGKVIRKDDDAPEIHQGSLGSPGAQVLLPSHEAHQLPLRTDETLLVGLLEPLQNSNRLSVNRGGHQHLVWDGGMPHILDVEGYGPAVRNLPAEGPLKLPGEEWSKPDDGNVWVLLCVRQLPESLGEAFLHLLSKQEEGRLIIHSDHCLAVRSLQQVLKECAPIDWVPAQNKVDFAPEPGVVGGAELRLGLGPARRRVAAVSVLPLPIAVVV
mmetsp:Transcript_78461/g.242158  ORF Transcript_78461/g.242158 Transcript_78461/m.242158 type:complete len:228 (-) Transcript_78461:274-957(-)